MDKEKPIIILTYFSSLQLTRDFLEFQWDFTWAAECHVFMGHLGVRILYRSAWPLTCGPGATCWRACCNGRGSTPSLPNGVSVFNGSRNKIEVSLICICFLLYLFMYLFFCYMYLFCKICFLQTKIIITSFIIL
jgi:hypothetical protein